MSKGKNMKRGGARVIQVGRGVCHSTCAWCGTEFRGVANDRAAARRWGEGHQMHCLTAPKMATKAMP